MCISMVPHLDPSRIVYCLVFKVQWKKSISRMKVSYCSLFFLLLSLGFSDVRFLSSWSSIFVYFCAPWKTRSMEEAVKTRCLQRIHCKSIYDSAPPVGGGTLNGLKRTPLMLRAISIELATSRMHKF